MHINNDHIFYHIYPLGACGAPAINDFSSQPIPRLRAVISWLDHIQSLGANALYLGPVFESTSHGYDTANYFEVDRRLGTHEDLAELSAELHRRGMKLVLDAVFNHVGRDFWAFQDLLINRQNSPYKDWFCNVNFEQTNAFNDPFCYDCWQGYQSLVELNLAHPAVREHLFAAVRSWKERYLIDGLRLDAADALDLDFLQALRTFSNDLDPNLWLMGEVIHGDYRHWANPQALHATTNYELYKSLWSSFNDHNFFELAYSLNRQYGTGGMYAHLPTLYTFADNHDVTRIATQLLQPTHLWPLYTLLFTLPGVPSIYYGSEFGFEGHKGHDDSILRPAFDLAQADLSSQTNLSSHLAHLAAIRASLPALKVGGYRQLHVSADQYAFLREEGTQKVVVAVNASDQPAQVKLAIPDTSGWRWQDHMNSPDSYTSDAQGCLNFEVSPNWTRILVNA